MAENKFDPYHAWLGIPKWDRPANAYRLLGIEVFEENRSVIEAAANRQMSYLQELSSGDEHIEEAQKLLGQISKARVVLLNPEKKVAYDKKLSDQLDSLAAANADGSQITKKPTQSSATITPAKKEKRFNQLGLIRIGLTVVIAVLIIGIALLFRPKGLVVRTYLDENNNQVFDSGEAVANVFIVKYFIEQKKPDSYSYDTNSLGEATLTDLKDGPIGFLVDPPFEIHSADDSPYYEVVIEKGPRFFSQVVNIPVRRIVDSNVDKSNQQVAEPSENPLQEENEKGATTEKQIAPIDFTLRGHVFTLDENGEQKGWEAPWYIDLDGNAIRLKGKEPLLSLNPEGKYEIIVPVKEIKSGSVVRPLVMPDDYQHPGGIAISLDEIRNGVLTLSTEMKRKPISYQGKLSVEPEEESPEGFFVYIDKNRNAQRDEDEPQSKTDADGNYQIQSEWFKDFALISALKIEVDPETYNPPQALSRENFNKKLPSITSKNNNFKITKKIALNKNETKEPINTVPTAENDPAAFLRMMGINGDLPEKDSETKPKWSFETNPELIATFNSAKREYDRASKKQNWNKKIPQLELAKRSNDKRIQDILKSAKTEAAKKRANQQILPYNKANSQIDQELSPLLASRDALLGSLFMAAQAVEQAQQQYQSAVDDAEEVKIAAENLGVAIEPLTKKQQAAWQPALQFLAERKLLKLGLLKQGRKWVPAGVAQEVAMLEQIKQFAQQNFNEYVAKKQQVNALIGQNNPAANGSQIKRLEQQLGFLTQAAKYKTAKTTFDSMTKTYVDHLSLLQSQRAGMETDKAAIEKALGGPKKYTAAINQYPTDSAIEKKREGIMRLQALVE